MFFVQALVSEQEQREEFQPPSPSHEEVPDEGHIKDMEHDDVYQPISLTENALKMHNILQVGALPFKIMKV